MKHIHLFQHTEGGCNLDKNDEMTCFDNYECECGAKFKAHNSPEIHVTMPDYIAGTKCYEDTPEE